MDSFTIENYILNKFRIIYTIDPNEKNSHNRSYQTQKLYLDSEFLREFLEIHNHDIIFFTFFDMRHEVCIR